MGRFFVATPLTRFASTVPMAFAGLSVLSIGYVQEHTGEVNAEMAEWRRRNGWPG